MASTDMIPLPAELGRLRSFSSWRVILYAYSHPKWKRVHSDILERRVLSVAGTVKLKKHRENYGTRYEVVVEKMKFPVMRRVAEAFQEEEKYCIYYVPHSKIALSAEGC